MTAFSTRFLRVPRKPRALHCLCCSRRCVRRAFLCGFDSATGKDYEHRRQWIEDRIFKLADSFAISVYAYAVMSLEFNRQVRRARLASTVTSLEPDLIAMEACSSSHYWGRRFEAMGYRVALIPAQHVKAFVRVNKSDAHNALAIAEASQRPKLKTVPVKSLEQQDLQMISRQRQRWIRHRTAVVNQIRSTGREYGGAIPLGYRALKKALPDVLEDGDNELTPIARELIAEWAEELRQLDDKIHAAQERQKALVRHNPAASALQEVPGFGPVVSAIVLSAVGDAHQFTNGRQMAAWMGLVPRHTGTGGRTRMLSISKNGDRELRTMMIHGARAVIRPRKSLR